MHIQIRFCGQACEKRLTPVRYCYDGDQIIAHYDSNGNLLRKFIYGPGIDEPISMIDVADNNKVYYYHFDGLGSVAALSNIDSEVVERYSYDVYGEPNRTSSVGNPYLFTGREYDIETGNYYYRARYYSTKLGRFLKVDPAGHGYEVSISASMNLHVYVLNNPVSFVDPFGMIRWSPYPGTGYYPFPEPTEPVQPKPSKPRKPWEPSPFPGYSPYPGSGYWIPPACDQKKKCRYEELGYGSYDECFNDCFFGKSAIDDWIMGGGGLVGGIIYPPIGVGVGGYDFLKGLYCDGICNCMMF